MRATRLIPVFGGFMLISAAGIGLQQQLADAGTAPSFVAAAPSASPVATQRAAASCPPRTQMPLQIAFTSNVADTSALNLQLPWGKPGDPEGTMVEDYGAYNAPRSESTCRFTTSPPARWSSSTATTRSTSCSTAAPRCTR